MNYDNSKIHDYRKTNLENIILITLEITHI